MSFTESNKRINQYMQYNKQQKLCCKCQHKYPLWLFQKYISFQHTI